MKKLNKAICFMLVIFSIITLSGCNNKSENNKITIISTNFPGYDFTRAITKDQNNIEVKMLLKPGSETHDFEPTPKDIINIKNSDIFIYVGGESDEWIKDILSSIDIKKTKLIKLMDLVDTYEEELTPGMESDEEDDEEEEEYDEHVWTSPINAIKIIKKLEIELKNIDIKNKDVYETNANNYINQLNEIDKEIRNIVSNAKRKEIIFGDRFPMRYFIEEYGLKYDAAFPGCSSQTEASAKTVSYLINKVKEDRIPVVFYIELSNKKIAETISKETGTKMLEFNSAHNIKQSDFDAGVTYVDIMKNNIKNLKEALN